jgi:hypothetical protein
MTEAERKAVQNEMVSLREYFEALLYSQKEYFDTKLESMNERYAKFESIVDVRMDHLNEIRPQLAAQKGEFMVKKSAYQKNKELVNAINAEDSYKIALAMRQDKGQAKSEVNYTKELYEWMKKQPVYGETKEYFIIHEGNRILKLHKE